MIASSHSGTKRCRERAAAVLAALISLTAAAINKR
jgi:hypothetical protein